MEYPHDGHWQPRTTGFCNTALGFFPDEITAINDVMELAIAWFSAVRTMNYQLSAVVR
jgi:hypothetical protein